MIRNEDIKDILKSARQKHKGVSERDIAFVVLCDALADKGMAYGLAYGESRDDADKHYACAAITALREVMRPFGIGVGDEDLITRAENKTELIKLLPKLRELRERGEIEAKDAVKMEIDIRAKLNDKFDMEEADGQKRIIVVPQKHDIICPHTNRECSKMPSKEACMRYYALKE